MKQTVFSATIRKCIIAFINEFGQRFGLTDSQAYRYPKTYGAITKPIVTKFEVDDNYSDPHSMWCEF